MNIAMFAWEALEGIAVGETAAYASSLAAALAGTGHRVRLFTRQAPGQAMDGVVGRVRVRRCAWDRKPNFVDEIESLANSFAAHFADAVKTDGPYGVIHCHEWTTVAAGLRARDISPARLAVSLHSTEWARTGVWPDAGDSVRIAELERLGIEKADAVAAASQRTRQAIHEQFHPPDWKCGLVYHGVDLPPPDAETDAAEETPTVLFAGNFSEACGGDLAAQAARIVAERFPEAKFLFTGSGPLEKEMRDAAGPCATFAPLHGRTVPAEQYRSAACVLAPFRRDTAGASALAAWAAAKPPVVLQKNVAAEFVVDRINGRVVAPDPSALAVAVMEALANPEETRWMGRNGRVAAETAFSWEESAKRLLALYGMRDTLTPEPEHYKGKKK